MAVSCLEAVWPLQRVHQHAQMFATPVAILPATALLQKQDLQQGSGLDWKVER